MSSRPRFSEVSIVYNNHVANLDKARRAFEEEVEVLNEFVFKHLEDRRTWPVEGIRKVRWGKPEPWSSARNVTWLNWMSATRVRMDIKPPGYKRFKKAAAYVFFQTSYDDELCKFVFACRLENQNSVNADIDEEAIALVQKGDPDRFPNSLHVKRNCALLYRCELDDSLYENINDWIDRALGAITETIDLLFPSSAYATAAAVDDGTSEDGDDDDN